MDVLKVRMVEKVEELKSNLEIEPLGDVRVLENSCVGLDKGRVPELVELLVALCALRGSGELPRRKHSS